MDLPVVQQRQIVGALPFANDICPVCYGASRTRLMCHYLERVVGVGGRPVRLLHVAPDIGMYYWLRKRPQLDYVPADLMPERYSIVPNVRKEDLNQLSFSDASFDVVVVSHVLEHVPDDRQAMSEVRRVLKSDGYGLFMGPEAIDGGETVEDPTIVDPDERKRLFAQRDHVRVYSREDFAQRLRQCGIAVEPYTTEQIDDGTTERLRLNPAEVLWAGHPIS